MKSEPFGPSYVLTLVVVGNKHSRNEVFKLDNGESQPIH